MIGNIFEEFEYLMSNSYGSVGFKTIVRENESSCVKELVFSNNFIEIKLTNKDFRDDVLRFNLEINDVLIRCIDTSQYEHATNAVTELNKTISEYLSKNYPGCI